MKKSILILIMTTMGFFSCKQGNKSTPDYNDKGIYTKYEYNESNGARLIIQNSLPKSKIHYTDPNGKKYVYAVFWTRITNETINSFELKIDFPIDSFEIPPSSGNYMKLLLPSDTMTLDKASLSDYGLAIKSFLDTGIDKSNSLKRTVNPKESTAFYVVTLSTLGVGGTLHGTLRTGLSLKGQNLFYRINDKEIPCGSIDLTKLMLRK